MPTAASILRVLVVDDNRDGADALGLLVEALGHQVHVTYGGAKALEVATAFRPDLMLVDLVMPDMDGCDLATRLRQIPDFAQARIVAITGQKGEDYISAAMKAGFDSVLHKPVALKDIKMLLESIVVSGADRAPKRPRATGKLKAVSRLPIEEARRIRSERKSKTLTQAEIEAAICHGIAHFQEEYLGWRSEQIQIHLVKDLVVIRIRGVLTRAEQQLGKALSPEKGRDLIKEVRKQLLEVARPMLESLVHEVAGEKVLSMHHDISTVTAEELVIFALAGVPRFA